MIIEMESDDPNASIVALHDGGRTTLRAGKNLVPLNAWKPGSMQFDFPGSEAPALKIIPERVSYHVIRGGVRTQKVSVMKTVTVMGRMVDNTGVPLGGASVINHAGRTLTELDGLFTLELHEKNPVISVEHPSGVQCEVHLDPARQKQQDIIFVGNLPCRDGTTETTTMRDRHS
jgi:outer membrane usher protein FimD/PapC